MNFRIIQSARARFRGNTNLDLIGSTPNINSTSTPGAIIGFVRDPFAGLGLGATVYETFGTVPGQLSLVGNSLVVGASSATLGTTYSLGVMATSGNGRRKVAGTFDIPCVAAIVNGNPATPDREVFQRSAYFGGESSGLYVDAPARGLSLPSGVTLQPKPLTDWYLLLWFKMEATQLTQNYEVLMANNGYSATGGNDNSIWLFQRATTGMGWTLGCRMQHGNSTETGQLLPGTGFPATGIRLEPGKSYCMMLGQVGNKARLRVGEVGGSFDQEIVGTDNFLFNGYYFPAGTATTSIVRNNGFATLTRSGSHGLVLGDVVRVESLDGLDNGLKIVAAVPNATSFGFATSAPNGSDTGAGLYAKFRTPIDMFTTLGRAAVPTGSNAYGNSGTMGPFSFHFGTIPNTAGVTDADWFTNVKNGNLKLANLGIRRYTHGLGDVTINAMGSITAPPTIIPAGATVLKAPSLLQADFLGFDHWPQDWPMATVFGQAYGTLEIGFRYTGPARSLWGRIVDSAGNVVVSDRQVAVPGSNGRGTVMVPQVPEACGYTLQAWWQDRPEYVQEFGPFDVGPVYGVISQSTLDVVFGVYNTSVTPISPSTGKGTILDVASKLTDSGINATNSRAWCRAAFTRVGYPGQMAAGATAMLNRLIEHRAAARGKQVSVGVINLCRSGHPADYIVTDRKVRRGPIPLLTGTSIVAGVNRVGRWIPPIPYTPNAAVYTLPGSVKLYIDGVLAATTDTAGNWISQGSFVITGSFTAIAGGNETNFNITSNVTGVAEIEATMYWNTNTASTDTSAAHPDYTDGYTGFGSDADETSGHMMRLITASRRMTGILYSWANYALSAAGVLNQSALNAQQAALIDDVRARYAAHKEAKRADTGADIPWVIMDDPRTASGEANEHALRIAHRIYAQAKPNTYYVPGPLSAAMDLAISPHADGVLTTGTALIGETIAHGIGRSEGTSPNSAPLTYLIAVERESSGAYVEMVFTPHPQGAQLQTGAGGKPWGIYYGTTTAVTSFDPTNYTFAFTDKNRLRITPNSGSFPATTYWNYAAGGPNLGASSGVTKAVQDARCADMLFWNDGGYIARPGTGVTFAVAPILAAVPNALNYTVVSSMDSVGTATSTTSDLSADTSSRKASGTAGLRIQTRATAPGNNITNVQTITEDMSSWDTISVCIDMGDFLENGLGSFRPYFTVGSTTYHYSYDIDSGVTGFTTPFNMNTRGKQWMSFKVDRFKVSTAGLAMTDQWKNPSIKTTGTATKVLNFATNALNTPYGNRYYDIVVDTVVRPDFHKPCVVLTFDDINVSQYNYALPEMKNRGLVGTIYNAMDAVGLSSRLTETMIGTMFSEGWSIGTDATPDDRPYTSETSVQRAIERAVDGRDRAIAKWGDVQGAQHLCASYGQSGYTAGPIASIPISTTTGSRIITLTTVGTTAAYATLTVGMHVLGAGFPDNTYIVECTGQTTVRVNQDIPGGLTSATFIARVGGVGVDSTGNNAIIVSDATYLFPGLTMLGYMVPAGTTIISVDSPTTITVSNAIPAACKMANFGIVDAPNSFWHTKLQDGLLAAGFKTNRAIGGVGMYTGLGLDPKAAINMPTMSADGRAGANGAPYTDTASIIANIQSSVRERCDVTLYMHNPGGQINNPAASNHFTAILDALVAMRDAGECDITNIATMYNRATARRLI